MVTIFSLSLPLDFILNWFPVCDCVFLRSQDIKLSAESQWQERISAGLFFSDLTFYSVNLFTQKQFCIFDSTCNLLKSKKQNFSICLSTSVLFNSFCRIIVWKTKGRGFFSRFVCWFFPGAWGSWAWNFVGTFCLSWSAVCLDLILIGWNGGSQLLMPQFLSLLHGDKMQ